MNRMLSSCFPLDIPLDSISRAISKGLFPSMLSISLQSFGSNKGKSALKADLEQVRILWCRAVFPSSSSIFINFSFSCFLKVWTRPTFLHLIATDKADIPGISPSPAGWCLSKSAGSWQVTSIFVPIRYFITWGLIEGNEQAFKSGV